jgi:pimeloyl-ACP methyl ester carboxylesterase
MPNFTLQILILFILIGVFAIACALWLGGPKTPPILQSIDRAFGQADYRGAKDINVFESSAGQLAFRHYAPDQRQANKGSVILIHGSSATSISMHNVAKHLAYAGFSTYALDMRGHGDSGVKGHIDKIGRLESDIIDFLDHIQPSHPRTLAGFSAGGGFTLRFAVSADADLFDSYLLLSPFIHQDAPTQRQSDDWAGVGVPRLLALNILNAIGVTWFNFLPVIRYGISPYTSDLLTGSYDYNLATNFRIPNDYKAAIKSATKPFIVLAGANDELFHTDKYDTVFASALGLVDIDILPDIDHAVMVLENIALKRIVAATKKLQGVE